MIFRTSRLVGYVIRSLEVFPKIGVPQNGWFILENPIKTFNTWGEGRWFVNFPKRSKLPGRSSGFRNDGVGDG